MSKEEIKALASQYFEYYQETDMLLITSDGQVFLPSGSNDANDYCRKNDGITLEEIYRDGKTPADIAAKELADKEAADLAAKELADKEAADVAAKELADKEAADLAAKELADKEAADNDDGKKGKK